MWRCPDGRFVRRLPKTITFNDAQGWPTAQLSLEELDALGYNQVEAFVPEKFKSYGPRSYVKEDFILIEDREELSEDLVACKKAMVAKINEKKRIARDGGFEMDGGWWDSDDRARIAYLELSVKLSMDPTFSTRWKCSNGTWVQMDIAKFQQLMGTHAAQMAAVYGWVELKQIEVANAESVEAVLAIDYGS